MRQKTFDVYLDSDNDILDDENKETYSKKHSLSNNRHYFNEVVKKIVKLIEKNYIEFGGWYQAFDTVLDFILYALEQKEDKYMELVKKSSKKCPYIAKEIYQLLFKAFCIDYEINDYLGAVYMEIASKSQSKQFGQYFTPLNVALLIARIEIPDIKSTINVAKKERRRISIHDPACGSGVMLLAVKTIILEYGFEKYESEKEALDLLNYFEFSGQDIDYTCVRMAKVQQYLTNYSYMTNLLLVKGFEAYQKQLNYKGGNKP